MRRIAAVTAVIALFGTLGAVSAFASHSWNGYHWERTTNPITLQLGNNVDQGWSGYLATTSAAWSRSSVLTTQVVPGGTSSRPCKATTGRIEVCNDSYGNNGWLGVAQIWISGSHISKGVVKVNGTYFHPGSFYDTRDERLHVLCQELGHTFGLDHSSEDGSSQKTCMDYSSSPNSTGPNAHDFEELGLIYAHLDVDEGGGTPPQCKNPKKCPGSAPGKRPPFAQASPGNGHVYVDDLGQGNKRVTFVYWTADARGKR